MNLSKLTRNFLIFVAAISFVSCGTIRVASVAQNVELLSVDNAQLKGLTGLTVEGTMRNEYKSEINVSEGHINVYLIDQRVATLTQIGNLHIPKGDSVACEMIMRVDNLNPVMMMALSSKFLTNDYAGITADLTLRVKSKRVDEVISREKLDINKFVTKFAK